MSSSISSGAVPYVSKSETSVSVLSSGSKVSQKQAGSQGAKKLQQSDTLKSGKSYMNRFLLCTAIFLSIVGTGFAAAASFTCLLGTISAGASGVGAAGVVPGALLTLLFGGLAVSGVALTAHLFTRL